jgi:hypothetical protein
MKWVAVFSWMYCICCIPRINLHISHSQTQIFWRDGTRKKCSFISSSFLLLVTNGTLPTEQNGVAVTPLTHMREVLGSNRYRETDYSDGGLTWFFSVPQCVDSPSITPLPLLFKSFQFINNLTIRCYKVSKMSASWNNPGERTLPSEVWISYFSYSPSLTQLSWMMWSWLLWETLVEKVSCTDCRRRYATDHHSFDFVNFLFTMPSVE